MNKKLKANNFNSIRFIKKIVCVGMLFPVILSLSACGIISVFVLAAYNNKETPEKGIARIESIIGISLPSDAEVKYHHYDMSFDGSYTQYTVLKLQDYPVEFLSNYPLVKVKESWGYDSFVRSVKGRNMKDVYIPSFDKLMISNKTEFSSGQGFTAVYFANTYQLVFFTIHVS